MIPPATSGPLRLLIQLVASTMTFLADWNLRQGRDRMTSAPPMKFASASLLADECCGAKMEFIAVA